MIAEAPDLDGQFIVPGDGDRGAGHRGGLRGARQRHHGAADRTVTFLVCERLAVPVAPFLIAEALASNIGGTATRVGDPPNIIIASRAGLSYNDFLVHLAPLVLVLLVVFIGLCRWLGVVGRSEQGDPTRTSSTTEADCAGYKFADVLLVGGNPRRSRRPPARPPECRTRRYAPSRTCPSASPAGTTWDTSSECPRRRSSAQRLRTFGENVGTDGPGDDPRPQPLWSFVPATRALSPSSCSGPTRFNAASVRSLQPTLQ